MRSILVVIALLVQVISSVPVVSGKSLYFENFQGASPGQDLATLGFTYPVNDGMIARVEDTPETGLAFDGRLGNGSFAPDRFLEVQHIVPAPTPGATRETWSVQTYCPNGSIDQELMVQGNPGTDLRWADIQIDSSGYIFEAFGSNGLIGSSTFAPAIFGHTATISIVFDWSTHQMYAQIDGGASGTSPSYSFTGAPNSLSIFTIYNDLRSPSSGCLWNNLLVQDNSTAIVPGDLNGDNKVDFVDYGILKSHWLQKVQIGTNGDLNSDGSVTLADFTLFKNDYLAYNGGGAGITEAVPEPNALRLVAAIVPVACIAWLQRRKRRRHRCAAQVLHVFQNHSSGWRNGNSSRLWSRTFIGSRMAARMGIFAVGLLIATAPAAADWQTEQIAEGNGSGGVAYQTAYTQELTAPGYDYIKPFGLVQMNDGEVAMVVGLGTVNGPVPAIEFSSDAGATWSAPERMPSAGLPTMFTYLGGGNLSCVLDGDRTFFSSDYGRTWPQTAVVPPTFNGYTFGMEGNAAVDRDANGNAVRIMEIGWSFPYGDGNQWNPTLASQGTFRYSLDGGRTWQGDVSPPTWHFTDTYQGVTYDRSVSEGSVVRAENGWLVAALRTDMPARFLTAPLSDHLEGTAISISKDNGQTWSPLNRLFDAGRHQGNLQLLPDGDLLLTMIQRIDINFGASFLNTTNRGEVALISHDNGLTWDPTNSLITISASPYYDPAHWWATEVGHVGTTVLNDGSVLTVYGKGEDNGVVLTKWNPNPSPTIALLVDPTTGSVSLSNQSFAHSQSLDGYTIQSASGSLQPASFSGFAAHNVPGWSSVGPSSAAISELNLTSSASLGIGQSYDLGHAFTPNGAHDLALQFNGLNAVAPTTVPVIYTNVVQLRVIALLGNGGTAIQSTVAMIANGASSSVALDGYSIVSAAGSLSIAGFNGFAGHGVAGWESVGPSTTGISELNLSSSSTLASNGVQVLGSIFAISGMQDLSFQYSDHSTGSTHTGLVLYSAQLAGDVNGDGVVNGLDISLIAANWLHTGSLTGDANFDGTVNGLDIALVASNWLNSLPNVGGGAGSELATVPEPTAITLIFSGCLATCVWMSGRQISRASDRVQ